MLAPKQFHATTQRRNEKKRCVAASLRETKTNNMTENEISKFILDASFKIHRRLGPGLFESVYENILAYELTKMGIEIKTQVLIPVVWDNLKMDKGFRADLIVGSKVIVEIKSIEVINAVHQKQLLTYLRLTNKKLGLLLNFNEALLRDGIQRIVNGL